MILIRKASERGLTKLDWLTSYHTFSFGEYYDPSFMGFSKLRVINEDSVRPGKGFDTHSHRDMEIISLVISGALEHKDSMGTGSIIKPGQIQRMSAGSGVRHSEFNPSNQEPVHFLQIWILPDKTGLTPGYEQKTFPRAENQLILIGSPSGNDHAVSIHQNVFLYAGFISKSKELSHLLNGKKAWLQLIKGEVSINGNVLKEGDGASITGEQQLRIHGNQNAEFLLFDFMDEEL